MARVQIGRKQRIETVDHDDATKAIARRVVKEIVNEGFNGADVLPNVWVIEKTIRNSIVNEQPNISPDISQGEVNELASTILNSVKVKTDIADEKVKSIETFEKQIDFPKELPTIKMGNVTVVKFPEGGADSERSIKVDGYKKVGKFYRKKPDITLNQIGKRTRRTKRELDIIRKEKSANLRRLKLRRGLLKPIPKKTAFGSPISLGRPRFSMPKPVNMGVAGIDGKGKALDTSMFNQSPGFFKDGKFTPYNKVDLNDPNLSPKVLEAIKKIKEGVNRETKPAIGQPMDLIKQNAKSTVGGLAVPSGPSPSYRIG
jgi:hypothetical protein